MNGFHLKIKLKTIYLHPKFGSWSLLKLLSIYAHSSIESSLMKKSSWNSSHNQINQLHSLTFRVQTQFTTTSTKYLFPAERSLLKLRSKQTREINNFSALFWGEFFSSTRGSTQIFPNVSSPTQVMACVMSHVILVSQSYCRVNDLGGKIPAASLLFVWTCMACPLQEDLHQRDLPNAVTKKIFKTFQSQVSVDITDNFWSLPSEDNPRVMVTGILRAER